MWRRMRHTNLAPLPSCHAPDMTRQRGDELGEAFAGERHSSGEGAATLNPKHWENQQPDEALAGVIKANG